MLKTIFNGYKIILTLMGVVIGATNKASDEGAIDLIGAYIRIQ